MRGPRSGFAGAECRRRGTEFAAAGAWPIGVLSSVVLAACAASTPAPPVTPRVASGSATAAGTRAVEPAPPPQPEQRQIRLQYQATPTCPSAESYVRQVESRSSTLSVKSGTDADDATQTVQVGVGITEKADGWFGDLTIADGEGLTRSVRGDRCEDVIEALALITVLRLDPSAAAAARESEPAVAGRAISSELATPRPAPGAPPEPAASTPEARTSETEGAVKMETPDTVLVPNAAAVDTRVTEGDRSSVPADAEVPIGSRANIAAVAPLSPEVAAGSDVESMIPAAVEPSEAEPVVDAPPELEAEEPSVPGAPLELELAAYLGYASIPSNALKFALQGELALGDSSEWGLSLILAYARGREENSTGSGTFQLVTAEAQLCGPEFTRDPRVWIQPCAGLRAGFLKLDVSPGERTSSAPGAFRPWAAIGPGFQAGAPIASAWTLRALGALSFTLVRDRFEVEQAAVDPAGDPLRAKLYRPELFSFELALGLGYSF